MMGRSAVDRGHPRHDSVREPAGEKAGWAGGCEIAGRETTKGNLPSNIP